MGGRASAGRGASERRSAAGVFGVALQASAAFVAIAGIAAIAAIAVNGAIRPGAARAASVSPGRASLRLTPSASARAGRPISISESGQVSVTSTLEVFAQLGQACLGSQGQEVAGGALHLDQRVIPAPPGRFTGTIGFTPATAGTYYICGYLDGASGATVEDRAVSVVVIVGPGATRPPTAVPGPTPAAGAPAGSCVVPGLARHSLAGARRLLAAAGCSLGLILRPSARGLSRARRRPGGGSLVLIVGSQFPDAGVRLHADQYVAIRLILGRAPTDGRRAGSG